jgi:UDP:flavonoid glycosyltransferase YjiC (YdhE family)
MKIHALSLAGYDPGMKIGMQTWGSHGDMRPFIALAEGLQAAGHEVTLVLTCVDSAAYAGYLSPHGVRVRSVASPVFSEDEAARIGLQVLGQRDPFQQLAVMMRHCYAPAEEQMFAAALDLAAECELLIGHFMLHPLQIAAEQAGKPYASVLLSHVMVPSAHNHPISTFSLGKPVNRALWWYTRKAMHRVLHPYADRLRTRLGMGPTPDMLTGVWMSPYFTLLGVSPQLCAPQPDWPASVHVSGFLDMPNIALEGGMPAQLADFLAAGPAPVYMTLGSWMPKDLPNQRDTLALLTQAARLAGCRAIIQAPAAAQCGYQSGGQLLYVAAAPHHAIFPLCAAVVHHGGAGTTQSATLAGKPSVVVAHLGEQEHWGNELRRIGVAGRPLRRVSVTARALARRIRQALDAPQMAAQAEAVARRMRQENGVAAAVAMISALQPGAPGSGG